MEEAQVADALYWGEIIASLEYTDYILRVKLDGSNSSRSAQTLAMLQTAWTPNLRSAVNLQVDYLYGYEGLSMFDNFGSLLIGFFIFFFVFLIAGISFLQERTSGTLEKLLSMPIERWQIVVGYALGFGILVALQSFLIALFCIYGLKIMMVENFFVVLLIVIMAALSALTLGILLSTVANNEFQMIQFIPIVIVPQVFFSGLFELPAIFEPIKYLMPLYYVADALTAVMIKGKGLAHIGSDLLFLAGCSLLFMLVQIRVLKKYRNI